MGILWYLYLPPTHLQSVSHSTSWPPDEYTKTPNVQDTICACNRAQIKVRPLFVAY